jgi:hypothetical protein
VLRIVVAVICKAKLIDVIFADIKFQRSGALRCFIATTATVVVTVIVSILQVA